MIATGGFLTVLECTKFIFGPLGELTALPDPLAGLRGTTSKGKGREREGEGREREGEGEGRGGKETVPSINSCICS